jgi:hypothetical protein
MSILIFTQVIAVFPSYVSNIFVLSPLAASSGDRQPGSDCEDDELGAVAGV